MSVLCSVKEVLFSVFFFFVFFFVLYFSILVMLFVANVSRLESFFSCILALALYLSVYYDFYSFFSVF